MPQKHRPKVEIANYDEVYDFYGSPEHFTRYNGKRRMGTHAVHNLLGRLLNVRVSYEEEAQAAILETVAQGGSVMVLANHVANRDPNTFQAALQQDPGLSHVIARNGLWTAARHGLFNVPLARTYMDSRNLVPVFRPKDLEGDPNIRLVAPAFHKLTGVLSGIMQQGDSVAIFPEGERNLKDPKTIQKVKPLAPRVALAATEAGVKNLGLVFAGVYRGPDDRPRGATVHIGYSHISETPTKPVELTRFMRDGMQDAVDGAVENY